MSLLPVMSSQTLARFMLMAATAASMDAVVMEEAVALEVAKGKRFRLHRRKHPHARGACMHRS